MDFIDNYITEIDRIFQSGNATKYSYRSALQRIIETADDFLVLTNEPKSSGGNKPDFSITQQKSGLLLGYIETKDIGKKLESNKFAEQFERYKTALGHIIITDYLRFQFWSNSEKLADITLGKVKNGKISGNKNVYEEFVNAVKAFFRHHGETVKIGTTLAEKMAEKAMLLKAAVVKALKEERNETEEQYADSKLRYLLGEFRKTLLPDVSNEGFADIYAQTVVYGLFAAKWHHRKQQGFLRKDSADNIPLSNPFLKRFFTDIADKDFDERVAWIVDDLVELLAASDIKKIMKNFGAASKNDDPVIHFYEGFLTKYDPKERDNRGVWFTPFPIVHFIVRTVDNLLKESFGLKNGLADNSKIDENTHKLHILDPATGTGTFLAETVKHIYKHQQNKKQLGLWQQYVSEGLLPRLHGFEILMAPYAIAYLKLEYILENTGFHFEASQQMNICLTNALDGYKEHPVLTGFPALAEEARKAYKVKQKTPVMVVIGNPPYNNSSPYNNGEWILEQLKEYKKELGEKKKNLDDDYIKFIRLAQYYIDQNGEGIAAYISNNSFLSGTTHRQMRKSVLESFDTIYIINLHGNSNIGRGETSPDGGRDENVFPIKSVGTSINIFIKQKKHNGEKRIFYKDVFGLRSEKFDWLSKHNVQNTDWTTLNPAEPDYYLIPIDVRSQKKYEKGFSINELFSFVSNSGVSTDRDALFIDFERYPLGQRFELLLSGNFDENFSEQYRIKDSSGYAITKVIKKIKHDVSFIQQYTYRPFDMRYIYYSKKIISRPADKAMQHLVRENAALAVSRSVPVSQNFEHVFVVNHIADKHLVGGQSYVFPLYLYNEIDNTVSPNLSQDIVSKIAKNTGRTPEPYEVFDYVYAVLYSPAYRVTFSGSLKRSIPRVPYPASSEEFECYVRIGSELRNLHLLKSVPDIQTTFDTAGDNIIEKPHYKNDKIYINKKQFIGNVPEFAWTFSIGGSPPLQSYLKYRQGRKLTGEEIEHYQKIIAVLIETQRLMNEME